MPLLSTIKKYNIQWGIFLGLTGFVANWFKLELFFNVDFLFGSLFVMLAIVRFGTAAGIIAGIIASSCTLILWHHPWAIIIMTAESVFVALRLRNKERDCLSEDIIFWLIIGAPLVWIFYFNLLHLGMQNTILIVLKQSINGVFNAILASAIHLLLRIRDKKPSAYPSLQEIMFITMISIILIPSFIYLVLKVRVDIQLGQQQIAETTKQTSASARTALNLWLNIHLQDVKLLSTLVKSPNLTKAKDMQYFVELVKNVSPAFLRMGVLDKDAVIIAYSPLVQNGIANIGKSFADRPFIPILKSTLQPYIPDVVPGRLANQMPILPLLAPMIDKNGYAGYCVGISDLFVIKKLLNDLVDTERENITVLDRNGNVVVTTRNDLIVMTHLDRSKNATVRQINQGYYHWIPEIKKGSSIMTKWMNSLYVNETIISDQLPWKVVVEISPRQMLNKLSAISINTFSMMATIIILSSTFARFISKSYVKSLQTLQAETVQIPELLDDAMPRFVNKSSRIKEMYELSDNFQQMILALYKKKHEAKVANQALIGKMVNEQKLLHEKEMLIKDLHDGIGGLMTKISMLAQYAKVANSFEVHDKTMDKILELAYEGGAEVRSFMNSLDSEQTAFGDLLAEISEHCERLFQDGQPNFYVNSHIEERRAGIGIFKYVNLVRIFREATTNILKHSAANNVIIELIVSEEKCSLKIIDDGKGYDVTKVRKRGVANMYSRAAHMDADFTIESSNSGTAVSIVLALDKVDKG